MTIAVDLGRKATKKKNTHTKNKRRASCQLHVHIVVSDIRDTFFFKMYKEVFE